MRKQAVQTFVFTVIFCGRALFARDYATDIASVSEAQAQALEQAQQLLAQTQNPTSREALQKAIKEMQHAELMLADAKNAPEKLGAAVAAEQSAYQDFLKIVPHEFQVSKSGGRGRSGGRAGQPRSGQIDQLELTSEDQRYETERQATAAATPQQREQLEIADRLKQLAQRQQDLNDRLKELQTALAEARTEQEREDIQRQLKRLSDEEHQMLSDVDDLKQTLDRSPNAASLSKARQQLDQARSDTQRASQELQDKSVSQALAAGARAQQGMQEMRQDLKNQASSQFGGQMRQLRSQARDLANQEEKIGKTLESLDNPDRKSLDDSAQRQKLVQQMAQQESGLTNLLGEMQNLSEQAETGEPLLSQQLYDTLRRASQMRNENLLETGEKLVDHGLVSQATPVEQTVRTNLNELREKVERAAQSVLGNETDALRYAQKELDDLSRQVAREAAGAGTNSAQGAAGAQRGAGTNSPSGTQPGNGSQEASNQNSGQAGSQRGSTPGEKGGAANATAGTQAGNGGQQPGENSAQGGSEQGGSNGQAGGDGDRLREVARQFGGANTSGGGGAGGLGGFNGPITGNQFVNWSDRMREVEQVVDSPDLRNRLAEARERVAAYRGDFRRRGQKPDPNALRTQVLAPMAEVQTRLQEDLARLANSKSLVPLDHDPVPENYSEMVRQYYEKLGGGQ
jgi:hypothetical protein